MHAVYAASFYGRSGVQSCRVSLTYVSHEKTAWRADFCVLQVTMLTHYAVYFLIVQTLIIVLGQGVIILC